MLDFPDELGQQTEPSILNVYKEAAVVSNTDYCSSVGRDMLKMGGSAVDAAIATLLCEHLMGMQNTGIGGGVLMNIYQRANNRAYCIDAREAAPIKAGRDMFNGNPDAATSGMLSVAVPGELMGYWEAHKKMGKLPWRQLFEPAIALCQQGVPISHRLSKAFASLDSEIMNSPTLRKIVAPEGKVPKEGEKLKLPILAKTMDVIASSPRGAMELYNGSLTGSFVSDIQAYGGIITVEDMSSYRARWLLPVLCPLMNGDIILHTFPAPGSGHVLSFILQLLDGIIPRDCRGRTYCLIAEAFKYGYALRTHLGDPAFIDYTRVINKAYNPAYIEDVKKQIFTRKKTISDVKWYGGNYSVPSDYGTANICVMSKEGDSVAATSTINTLFGSLAASTSTGIILNNEMDDFSSPRIINSFGLSPSEANFIAPGKRPFSSMCPSIFTEPEGNVRLIVGAAGGSHITTSVAQVAIRHLWYGQTVKEAIESPRIHHQLQPMVLRYENGLSTKVVKQMESYGHIVKSIGPHSSVTAISKKDGNVSAMYDYRRGGSTSGY